MRKWLMKTLNGFLKRCIAILCNLRGERTPEKKLLPNSLPNLIVKSSTSHPRKSRPKNKIDIFDKGLEAKLLKAVNEDLDKIGWEANPSAIRTLVSSYALDMEFEQCVDRIYNWMIIDAKSTNALDGTAQDEWYTVAETLTSRGYMELDRKDEPEKTKLRLILGGAGEGSQT